MLDKDEALSCRSIRGALAHLYQPEQLRADPLAAWLIEAGLIQTADEAAGLLQSAIEHLRPGGSVPRGSPGWRQFRYLQLRYVECATHRQIAEELQVSTRQACREHEAGLNGLASYLWSRLGAAAGSRNEPERPAERSNTRAAGASTRQSVEAELLRLGSEPPDSPTSLREVLDGALATVARLVATQAVTIQLDLSPDLPPVAVNRLALRHILLNLLGYMIDGSRARNLLISAGVGVAGVELSFVMGGASSSVDVSRPPSEEPPGLAMARQLVEMQGGQLRVKMLGSSPLWAVIALPATQATTVLLVDDSADIGRLFRRYLDGTGYCLVHARSAEKARRLVRDVRPGVILLDVILPRDDGWQLLDSLRANETTASVPVIVCSVVPEESLAVSLGVEFLPKPVSRLALLAALERICRLEEQAANPGKL